MASLRTHVVPVDTRPWFPASWNPHLPATLGQLDASPRRDAASRLALKIATGIGLHNFAEGLTIGPSATAGDMALTVILIIGFACTTPPSVSASWHR
jgi:zinc transporter ZupT